jgi:hypothetical protein
MVEKRAASEPEGEVVRLHDAASRRRRPTGQNQAVSPAGDLEQYQQSDDGDDYRDRMIVNVAAIAFLLLLIVGGIWIANTMAAMRKNQDCVLSGRRGCTPVDVPLQQRW